MPKASAIESIDTDVTPLALEAPPPERQRMAMLPAALLLSLGLVLGYAAGYVRGSRETLAVRRNRWCAARVVGVADTDHGADGSEGNDRTGGDADERARRCP